MLEQRILEYNTSVNENDNHKKKVNKITASEFINNLAISDTSNMNYS